MQHTLLAIWLVTTGCVAAPSDPAAEHAPRDARAAVRAYHADWPIGGFGAPSRPLARAIAGITPLSLAAADDHALATSFRVLADRHAFDAGGRRHGALLVWLAARDADGAPCWLLAHVLTHHDDARELVVELASRDGAVPLRTYGAPPTPEQAYAFVAASGWMHDVAAGSDGARDLVGWLRSPHWFAVFGELPGELHFGELADLHRRVGAGLADDTQWSSAPDAAAAGGAAVREIVVERQPGWGRGEPVWIARLSRDGSVVWIPGRGDTQRRVGRLPPERFDALARRVERLDFGRIPYDDSPRHPHLATAYIRVVRDGASKVVRHGGTRLTGLIEAFEAALETVHWRPGPSGADADGER